jgi:ethanolamine utilization protein EutQ
MACYKHNEKTAKWVQFGEAQIFLGDMLDAENSTTMGVGYARYDKGAANEWTLTYDEALIILQGRFSVEFDGQVVTADAGEIIWIEKGTSLTYRANEATVLVYVSYPVWGATEGSHEQSVGVLRSVEYPPR